MASIRALVTGGAGFLGSHLCDRLVSDGHEVLSVDDYSSGSRDNIASLAGHPRFTSHAQDVREPMRFERLDRIYHLACPASPSAYQADPIGTARTAVIGTLEALELARRTGARCLLASTSEVYGEPEVHPQPESYLGHVRTDGPRACYDEGKRMAEALCFDYARVHGLVVKVARIFNTYGPRMSDDGRVISGFLTRALRGEPIVVFGEGTQTRSFCYVDDMVEGLVRFMESDLELPGPLNLGNDEEVSILELASAVRQLIPTSEGVVHEPQRHDDPTRRCPDISLARERLGWLPEVSLAEGLARTVAQLRREVPR